MIGTLLEVLQLLLAVHHLPALDAEDFSVGLGSDLLQAVYESGPL